MAASAPGEPGAGNSLLADADGHPAGARVRPFRRSPKKWGVRNPALLHTRPNIDRHVRRGHPHQVTDSLAAGVVRHWHRRPDRVVFGWTAFTVLGAGAFQADVVHGG